MTTPLLTARLHIPPIRPEFVSRPRLIQQWNAGLHLKLISAPADFGMATPIVALLQRTDGF